MVISSSFPSHCTVRVLCTHEQSAILSVLGDTFDVPIKIASDVPLGSCCLADVTLAPYNLPQPGKGGLVRQGLCICISNNLQNIYALGVAGA